MILLVKLVVVKAKLPLTSVSEFFNSKEDCKHLKQRTRMKKAQVASDMPCGHMNCNSQGS